MPKLNDVYSLSEFQRNAKAHIKRLKKQGKPEVLTINGKAELVVQDAASYQKLLASADMADSVRTVRQRIDENRSKDVPAHKVLKGVRDALRDCTGNKTPWPATAALHLQISSTNI